MKINLAYNPNHLAGVADVIQAISQMLFAPISDYDLHNVLRQMEEDDTTRKLLIVGHSQGALYANSIYEYLTAHGEPARALDVYAVATPASYVAGGGKYINSNEDAVILTSKLVAQKLGVPAPLASNIAILGAINIADLPRTHLFGTYLNAASDRIVADINSELDALKGEPGSETSGCFTPPDVTTADKIQQAVFAIADPASNTTRAGVVLAYQGTALALAAIGSVVHASYAAAQSVFGSVAALVSSPKINPAAPENQDKNFSVVKKLYGSSLDQASYDEINSTQGGAAITALLPDTVDEVVAPTPPDMPATTTPVEPLPLVLVATTTTATTATTTPPVIVPASGGGSSLPPPAPQSTATISVNTNLFDASTTPPVLTVAECSSSLNTNFCLIATTTATLSWSSVTNALYYGVQVNGTVTATTTSTQTVLTLQDQATTTLAVVAYDEQNSTATSTATDVTVAVPVATSTQVSSVSDTFNSFNSLGWQTFGGNVKNFDVDDNPGTNCFSGGCVVGSATSTFTTLVPRMYVEIAPALDAGAYTVYARARQGSISNPHPVISICQATQLGCTNGAAINFLNQIPLDDTWHQYYFAWRQGSSFVQSCFLTDDTNSTHCSWTDTSFALGTQFDGVGLWSTTGYRADFDANLWFDELVAR